MAVYNDALAAIKSGDAAKLNQLLDSDSALADTRDTAGVSLVVQCCYLGQKTLAEAVAKRRTALDAFELAALGRANDLLAAISDDESLLKALSSDGFTLLHYACYFGSDPCVKMLLEQGADPNVVADNSMKVTPLHSAVAADRRHAVNMLILAGADVNAKQQKGFTALHGAANTGDIDIIQALVDAGADPFARSETGEGPLEVARRAGHIDAATRIDLAMRKAQ